MKKKLLTLFSFSLSCLFAFTSSSCSLFRDYEKECMQDIRTFVDCLNGKDADGIKSFFASKKIEEISDFDDSVDHLLSYYDTSVGELESFRISGEEGDQDGNYKAKWYLPPYKIDVEGTLQYRIYFYWCFYYTLDGRHIEDYEGIWSFYIIKETEYDGEYPTYAGDGKRTPGINIGKQ